MYSKENIDRAGSKLISMLDPAADLSKDEEKELSKIMGVLTYWRTLHNYPLNTFKVNLRTWCKKVNDSTPGLVAQRLKRGPSIVNKLERFPNMKLSRMQDIGGLRAILKNKTEVYKLTKVIKNSKMVHVLKNEKDYIVDPKQSGYRGIHLIYQFNKREENLHNGLLIELQIRTKIQHSWATAVEVVGTFLRQSLKSSQGNTDWLNFFEYVSSGFAILERSDVLQQHKKLNHEDIFKMIYMEEKRLDVIKKLETFKLVPGIPQVGKVGRKGQLHLIKLDSSTRTVDILNFAEKNAEEASSKYSEMEEEIKGNPDLQIVLVKSNSISNLEKSYPNYFLDTEEFINNLKKILKKHTVS